MCWLVFFYCCEIRDPFEEQAALYDPRPSVSVLSFSLGCYGCKMSIILEKGYKVKVKKKQVQSRSFVKKIAGSSNVTHNVL